MSGDKRALLKEWLASGKAHLQPLTFPQRELWETSPVAVTDNANHICCLIQMRGVITPDACEAAIQRVVERQEVMRLSFLPGKDRPIQMIRHASDANFRFRELSPTQSHEQAVEDLAREIFSEPFDFVQGPLYRVEVLRRAADDHVLVLAIHHAIADGWTLGVFIQDLCVAYVQGLMGLREGLPPVPLTYAAWGAAERALWQPSELKRRAAFWKSNLAGIRRLWNSQEGPESVSSVPDRWVSHFPVDLADAARELARVNGTTLFNTLLAAFQIALSRWTGEQDILVGTPVANRSKQAVRETMGYCAGIVPLRGQVDVDRPFSASLKTVHQTTVDCFANAMPFAELVPALEEPPSPGQNPIFEVRFALQNHPVPDVTVHGLSARLKMRSTGTARFQLGCEITVVDDGFQVVWLFRPKLFPLAEIKNLAYLFQAVLAGTCRSPESRIAALMI
ncbi:MAG TPA: condensation domain-containing protein [Chthoniobacterales bacterium]|nr:condensation domain-containing protein [Chthoniobacterales bacterium]